MGVRSWLGFADPSDTAAQLAEIRTLAANAETRLEMTEEALIDAQMALDDAGWNRLGSAGDLALQGVTLPELRMRVARAQLLGRSNPLVLRGLMLRYFYVWGSGVEITARSTGPSDETPNAQDVSAVVQAFLDDPGNQRVLTGDTARQEVEIALGTDGNLFLALFTSPLTGLVQVRSIPFAEIHDIITNPEDRSEPWYYRRQWTQTVPDLTVAGGAKTQTMTAYYPALGYRPRARVKFIDGAEVMWDAPILHPAVNRPHGAKFGLPDAYAATYWAELYREFLVDWSKLMKSLSKMAWRATSKDKTRKAVRAGLDRALSETGEVGAAATMDPDTTIEAIPKTGATIDAGSGRPLAAMVAAALGVPVTMLLGDPGVTGARATAETLDRPTELMAMARRGQWTSWLQQLLSYVVDQAVKAPRGPLKGTVLRDDFGREVVTLAGDTDRTVSVDWPDLTETPINFVMQALAQAEQMNVIPSLTIARLVLQALGVEDIDEILAEVTDPATGEFKAPDVSAGDVAARAFRNGQDPAAALMGAAPAMQDQAAQ